MKKARVIQHTLFGPEEVKTPSKKREETLNDYDAFVEKFKPKLTTDDCYTPPEVYEGIREWVSDNLLNLGGLRVHRPFYPGGDYQREAEGYGAQDVVIDNPPFSILSKIVDYYVSRGIRFFLFAPALTLFIRPRIGVTFIVANIPIVYENGAEVNTSFVTNLENKHRVWVAGEMYKQIEPIIKKLRKRNKKQLKKKIYPIEVITSAILGKIAARGISFKVPFDECEFVRKLDNYSGSLFGGGFLISERAAAERAAAERAAAERAAAERAAAERAAAERAALSSREKEIINRLSKKYGNNKESGADDAGDGGEEAAQPEAAGRLRPPHGPGSREEQDTAQGIPDGEARDTDGGGILLRHAECGQRSGNAGGTHSRVAQASAVARRDCLNSTSHDQHPA